MKKIAAPEQKLIYGGHSITVLNSTSGKSVDCSYTAKGKKYTATHYHYKKLSGGTIWKQIDCSSWY